MRSLVAAGAICLGIFIASVGSAYAKTHHHYRTHRVHSHRYHAEYHHIIPADDESIKTIIRSAADKHSVPENFAIAIARKESGFKPSASNHGALGLFQIKCGTAKGIGYKGSCDGLFDARTNAEWGTEHLRLALKKCGNLAGAAKLHNAGLGSSCRPSSYSVAILNNLR